MMISTFYFADIASSPGESAVRVIVVGRSGLVWAQWRCSGMSWKTRQSVAVEAALRHIARYVGEGPWAPHWLARAYIGNATPAPRLYTPPRAKSVPPFSFPLLLEFVREVMGPVSGGGMRRRHV